MLSVSVRKRRDGFTLQVAFEAPTPGIVALFGRSGCGKTTTVEIIAGLLAADEASVRLDGFSFDGVPAEKRRIGYVFQDARLFPHYDVAGNLRYGMKRAPGAEHVIGFGDVVSLLGLGALLSRRPHQLSGGERQRVALGRALLSQPRLLLLDEPLASLDVARREEVLPYLEALRDRLALPMVYVSHQFDEVLRLATHVVLLEAGQVVAQGSIGEVSLSPQLRAIVGPDAVGAVIDGVVTAVGQADRLAEVRIGRGTLRVTTTGVKVGDRVRVQLLAREIILAIEPPRGLSVRNAIEGTIQDIADDGEDAQLVRVDIGGATVLSRVTHSATQALALKPGTPVWLLVKAVSLRAHPFRAPGAD